MTAVKGPIPKPWTDVEAGGGGARGGGPADPTARHGRAVVRRDVPSPVGGRVREGARGGGGHRGERQLGRDEGPVFAVSRPLRVRRVRPHVVARARGEPGREGDEAAGPHALARA